MAKKIILIFLGLFVLIIGGLSAYVSTVDWNTYKNDIAEKFSEITGKKIEFSGSIDVQILPQPTLSAKNVKIINPNNPADVLATIDNLNTEVSLQSLLKGSPDIRSLSLIGTEIWININEKGELNWSNYGKSISDSDINTRLQSLSLQNALLHLNNEKSGIKFDLSQLNADVQAETLAGPYRLDGNFVKDEDHFGVAVSLGSFSGLADVPVNFAITHPKSESFLRFDGTYMPNEQAYKGDFSGGSKQTANFANILSGMQILDENYNVPLQFSVGVETDSEQIKLSSFIIKYDGFIEGSGTVIIPLQQNAEQRQNVDIKYQLVNLDLRPLLSILKAEYKKFVENGSVYKPDFNVNINADISSERVVLNDGETGAWESVSFKGSWADNTLSLDEFYAACAGNTVLTMDGSLVEEKNSPQYFLKVSLDSKDFLAFLNSMGASVKSYTQSTYRNALVSFNLSGNNNAVSANDIKLMMDKMNISGVAGITFGDNSNVYELQLLADTLNLDNYLPKNEKAQTMMDNIRADIQNLSFLKWLKMHASLHADNLTFRGVQMTGVNLNMEAADGNLQVKELLANGALSSKIKLSAAVSKLGSLDLNFDEVNFDFQSNKMNEVNDKLKTPWPNWNIFKAGNFQASGMYSGDLHQGNLDIKISADDNRFAYKGVVKQEEEFGFDGQMEIKTMNFSELVNNLGGSLKTTANNRGAFNCTGDVSGKVSNWSFKNTNCVLGIANYKGEGTLAKEKNNYRLNAEVNVDEFNIENVIDMQSMSNIPAINRVQKEDFFVRPNFSKDAIVFDLYRNLLLDVKLTTNKAIYKDKVFNDLKLHILNSNNIMQLNDISVGYNDVDLSGNIQISYDKFSVVKGHLEAKNINLQNAGGSLYRFSDGLMSVNTDFNMPASSIDEFVNNFSGKIHFEAENTVISGMEFIQIQNDLSQREYSKGLFQKVRDSLQTGETSFSRFGGDITAEQGNLQYDNFVMQNDNVDVSVSGNVDIPNWKINNLFDVSLKQLPEVPQFSFSLSGMLNKPSLDINIEDIVKKYDAHWKEIEEEKQAQKAARLKELNEQMAAAQQQVTLVSDYVNRIVPVLESRIDKSDNEIQIAWYKGRLARLNEINRQVDSMQSMAHLADFTEENVEQIKNDCAALLQELTDMEKDSANHYHEDVQNRYQNVLDESKTYNDKTAELMQKYQQLQQDKLKELENLGAAQQASDSLELKDFQTKISELNENIRPQIDALVRQCEDAGSLKDDVLALENVTVVLQKNLQSLAVEYENMEDIYAKTAQKLQEFVDNGQKVLAEEKAKKQAEQKLNEQRENTNLLDVENKNTQNDMPKESFQPIVDAAKTHIDDEAPEAIFDVEPTMESQKNRPTLRKITNNIVEKTVSGTIKKSYEKEVETPEVKTTTKSLLKEADGAVQKPTGRIVVK